MLLSLLSGLYRVHGLRVSSLCPVARWHYLPPLTFQKVLLCLSLSFPLLFHHAFFVCLRQPFCIYLVVCICLHHDDLSSVVLISVLIYQSAAFVFLNGSQVSLELVMVNLAFYLSLAQLFLLCALMTVVVHSFVADSTLLDSDDLVGFCCCCFFPPPYACR